MLNDTLANALTVIKNSELVGKKTVVINPYSKLIGKVLSLMKDENYLGSFEVEDVIKGPNLKLNLLGKINSCGAIKPRKNIKFEELESFEKRFLPAKGFGILLLSTPQGVMTNEEAKKKKIGGRLLAYCY